MIALPLLAAASDKPTIAAGDFAEGALSLLVSKRCEASPKLDTKTIEWPALVYGPGRPPAWGRKPAGACRGLDTWVLSESLNAGAYWATNDHQAIEKEGGSRFSGPDYLKQAAAEALPKDQEQSARAGRTLGVILRRTGDGTWPIVNRLLKKVVGDYDPDLSRGVGQEPLTTS